MTSSARAGWAPAIAGMSARQKSLAFFTLIVALVLEIVDTTIVNTALPAIQADFGGSSAHAQWVVVGYSLSFAVLLMLGGRLGDLFGCRAMFLLGVAGFTVASILCGGAQNAEQLVWARVLQGAAGAIMGPQVLALIQILYEPVERIGRLAWFGVIGGLSAIAGPILGGLLIGANLFGLGWRSVFLVNGPIGVMAVIAGLFLLPRAETKGNVRQVDLVGTLQFGGALAALLYPLVWGERLEWHWPIALYLGAAVVLALAGWRGLKRRAAAGGAVIFDPALFANHPFRQGLVVAITFSAANTGFLFIFAYSLQRQLGYSPLETGLIHMPFSAGVMFGIAFIGRRFLARAGKYVLIGGLALMAMFEGGALVWIAAGGPGFAVLVPMLVAAGVGMGMLSGPIPPVTVARVERHHAGAASGILKTVQQMGAAIGVAVMGTVYFAFAGCGVVAALAVLETLILLCFVMTVRLPSDIFPSSTTHSA
ncbi:MFS transporter [Sphingomonas tabacisoli]|uniref:MFS transporter n=1 Tax=Sphingomonas tabacisoli TaxID=2249466 RepID=A0ABW4I4S4_9SPHN